MDRGTQLKELNDELTAAINALDKEAVDAALDGLREGAFWCCLSPPDGGPRFATFEELQRFSYAALEHERKLAAEGGNQ